MEEPGISSHTSGTTSLTHHAHGAARRWRRGYGAHPRSRPDDEPARLLVIVVVTINHHDRSAHPNFVLICTDQQRADFLGCGGHPVLRTPHIDSIASRGTRFERCYVSSPQCMPNRATMMTGRTPSVHGVRTNGIPLPLRSNTFVDLLRAEGYRTALVGKSHLQNMLDAEPERLPKVLRQRRNGRDAEYADAMKPDPAEDYGQERSSAWEGMGYVPEKRNYYGYEHVELCTLHGDMAGGDYYRWLRSRRYDIDRLRGRGNTLPHDYRCPQAWRTAIPEELYSTRYIQERSVDWLSSYETRRNDRPFFLMVSFPDPHHPFTPPGRFWDMYRPEDMTVPASLSSASGSTPFLDYTRRNSRTSAANEYHAITVSEREAREAAALTCGMMAMVDEAVGAVLAALTEQGRDRDTVVLFTSDHGDLMGDHGLLLKGPFHYQGLIRVPLIWADPFRSGRMDRVCNDIVGSIDLAPSILGRAGIDPFHGMQGRNLEPLLAGNAVKWRETFLVEEEQHDGVLGHSGPLVVRTLVAGQFRMTVYLGLDWGELYDLREDPLEQVNLWDESHARRLRGELLQMLAQTQMNLIDPSPMPTRLG